MKKLSKLLVSIFAIIPCLLLCACGTLNVSGRTFKYDSVEIDWGMADDEAKNALFEEYQVENESELRNVLKTKDGRNNRFTTFGTDGKYTTKNGDNEVLDSGFYKQDETLITLADTEEGLSAEGAYTLEANDKGYIVTIKLDDTNKIFAKYQYSEQE